LVKQDNQNHLCFPLVHVKPCFIFTTLQAMNAQDEIKAVQEELDALKKQFNQQYQKIVELQQRLNQLTGKTLPSEVLERQRHWSLENFIGLRLIHFIGIVVLVIGLSIGVKYAIDRELVSEGARIALAYAAGLILYFLSIRLRPKFQDFSAILFGGAMASLYFTTYAAHVKYSLFPFGVAFAMMVSFTVYTVYEAMRYNLQEIALLGLVGAYGIPFLISKNADRADLFFLYITLINLGVIFLVIKKTWRALGMVAQAITWLLFIGWASVRFNAAYQMTGLIFMLLFFFIFQFAVIAIKLYQKQALILTDTYQVILNNLALYIAALFVFGFYKTEGVGLGLITLVLCCFVAVQAVLLYKRWKDEFQLTRSLSALALTLFVLFIAFTWDGFTVTLLWLLTAVIVFAIGFRLRSVRARMASMILMGITLAKLLAIDSMVFTTVQKVVAYLVLGILLLVVSFFYQKFRQQLFGAKGEEL
jgi:uncharacterized membrane protein